MVSKARWRDCWVTLVFLASAMLALTACWPAATSWSNVQPQACGPELECPADQDCVGEVCVAACEATGSCVDAGDEQDAGCGATGSCDDASLEIDASLAGVRNCADAPCFAGVTCRDLSEDQVAPGDDLFRCGDCPTGYQGDGVSCDDIDGCADAPCFADVTCSDVAAEDIAAVGAEFMCGDCPAGYRGDGLSCTDINECNSDPCSNNQTCHNTVGSYDCVDDEPQDCTLWDYVRHAPCISDHYNCDCANGCDSTSPCDSTNPPDTNWPPTDAVEIADFHGRYNGNRPTWYFDHVMSAYPASFTIVVVGCASFQVSNNGTRFEYGGYIVKQSDVAGRGMAVVGPASCLSERCYYK